MARPVFVLLFAALVSAATPAAAAGTDLAIAYFGWRTKEGCGGGPRAIIALDITYKGAAPSALSIEVRYRWRKRPRGQWFERTLPVANQLVIGKKVQRINLYLPVDSSGATWEFEAIVDPDKKIAETGGASNRARFSGTCGGRKT